MCEVVVVVGKGGFSNAVPQGRSAAKFIFIAGKLEMLWKESAAKDRVRFQMHSDIFSLVTCFQLGH